MVPVLAGLGIALAVLVCGWLVRRAGWQFNRALRGRADRRRLSAAPPVRYDLFAAVESATSVAAVGRGEPRSEEDAAGAVEREASEITNEARRTAAMIVREAEEHARAILAEAELERTRLEQALERRRKLLDEKRGELSTMLAGLLAEVRATLPQEGRNVFDLDEVRRLARSGESGASD